MVWIYCTLENTLNFPFPLFIYLFGSALHFILPLLGRGVGKTLTFQAVREREQVVW